MGLFNGLTDQKTMLDENHIAILIKNVDNFLKIDLLKYIYATYDLPDFELVVKSIVHNKCEIQEVNNIRTVPVNEFK